MRPNTLPLAVLGDSDSHGYRDPARSPPRGGDFHAVTLQWTEVLDTLRGDLIDQGAVGSWGTRRRYVMLSRLLGLRSRLIRKRDFRFNLAGDGDRCAALTEGYAQQVDPLLKILEDDPEAWSEGVVVARVGVNDLFRSDQMTARLEQGLDADAEVAECVGHITTAVARIRETHSRVFIVVSGLFNELAAGTWMERPIPSGQRQNVLDIVDRFQSDLTRALAAYPRVAVLDEQDWWRDAWGEHDPATGEPRPKAVSLGGPISVTNTVGDHPRHAILSDGHAGTVVNAYWANHLIEVLNERLGVAIPPLTAAEIAGLVDPDGSLGIAPPS